MEGDKYVDFNKTVKPKISCTCIIQNFISSTSIERRKKNKYKLRS